MVFTTVPIAPGQGPIKTWPQDKCRQIMQYVIANCDAERFKNINTHTQGLPQQPFDVGHLIDQARNAAPLTPASFPPQDIPLIPGEDVGNVSGDYILINLSDGRPHRLHIIACNFLNGPAPNDDDEVSDIVAAGTFMVIAPLCFHINRTPRGLLLFFVSITRG